MRLTDFGMSVIAEGTGYNYGSVRGGAVRWLAPELLDPEQFDMDHSRPTYASDVYAFALTAVEVCNFLYALRYTQLDASHLTVIQWTGAI